MRLNRSLLPKVHLSHKDKGYGFDVLAERYAAIDKRPLIIDAVLATPYVPAGSDQSVHLDGILSQAVLTAHPCAPQFNGQACIVPLPIEILWLSAQGLPLWAASDMLPDGDTNQAREYWHKRYPSHRADFGTKLSATTTAGRWKEYRVPLNAVRTDKLRAVAVGNKAEIERLLSFVSHLGKKGSAGYGRVAQWGVSDLPVENALDLILSAKAVPVDYAVESEISGIYNPLKGWTPPYWYAPNWSPCMAAK